MEHRQFETKNGAVHYWIHKNENPSAPCIVFTHGLTADHTMFEKQVAYFAPDYTVLTWDVPIHGLSRPYRNFSYEETAVVLHGILAQEGIGRVVLVGMSMGGYPSQMFAHLYPAQVDGFVALDTTPFGHGYYSKSDLFWLRHTARICSWFPEKMLKKMIAKYATFTPYSYELMMAMLAKSSKQDVIEQIEVAFSIFPSENRDMEFDFPVLILLGDHDKNGKVVPYCKQWSKQTGYPLHIIKNAAHFANGDNPEQVNGEIEGFILTNG